MDRDAGWTSPSDLADFAYCPRSHWYRNHPPPEGPTRSSQLSALVGERYHERILTGELHHEQRGGAYLALLLVGVALAVGGVWWILHP
jgi:CRISPR/Cas system-associated exonuclease Cas4 (RecB family)